MKPDDEPLPNAHLRGGPADGGFVHVPDFSAIDEVKIHIHDATAGYVPLEGIVAVARITHLAVYTKEWSPDGPVFTWTRTTTLTRTPEGWWGSESFKTENRFGHAVMVPPADRAALMA